MIGRLTILGLLAVVCVPAFAQEHEHAVRAKNKSATLMAGLGDWRHPVSTPMRRPRPFSIRGYD